MIGYFDRAKGDMMGPIGIFGAGAVGCHIGGRLAMGGATTRLLGRPGLRHRLEQGLRLTDLHGFDAMLQPDIVTEPAALSGCDLILITVTSGQTEDAARALAPVLKPQSLVISFQSGVRNQDILARYLPQAKVLAGMLPYHLDWHSPAHLHQASAGQLMVQDDPALAPWLPVFAAAGLSLQMRPDMQAVLLGKLLLDLNNAINALANIPVRAGLENRLLRECLALAMAEALALLQADRRITPARLTPVANSLLPTILRLPNWLYRRAAAQMLDIDAKAHSSMSNDLAAGRPTEIDWLNGEIVALGDRIGIPAPINHRLCQLIHQASAASTRPSWTGPQLLAELRVSRYVPTA